MIRYFFGCLFIFLLNLAACLSPDPCEGPRAEDFQVCLAKLVGNTESDADGDSDSDSDTDADTDSNADTDSPSTGETGSTDPPATGETGQTAVHTAETGWLDTGPIAETGDTAVVDTGAIATSTGDTGSVVTSTGDTGRGIVHTADTGLAATGDTGQEPVNDPTTDDDGDGFSENQGDCDDGEPLVRAGFPEICDDLDNDCDTVIDDGVQQTFYEDADGDGYGDDVLGSTELGCTPSPGYAALAGDCNDADGTVYPGAPEPCVFGGQDNNCDGSDPTIDNDGDSWISCAECDDGNGLVYPGGFEFCDDLDNDCDGVIDDGALLSWHPDFDFDGYGNPDVTVQDCIAPPGFVADATDCDDSQSSVHPGLVELCDGGVDDEDCDGLIDDADSNVDGDSKIVSYEDKDDDGYTDYARDNAACTVPEGYVMGGEVDCDDLDASVYPGAPIGVCDSADTGASTDFNCDGSADCP